MATLASLEEIELPELALSVDGTRAPADPFKLFASLRTELGVAFVALKAADSSTIQSDGGRSLAAFNLRTALDQLRILLRDGFNYLQGLGSYQITEGERLAVMTAYGWESGHVGPRIESLANEASAATPTIANPVHRYPTPLLGLIEDQLDIVNGNQPIATGGVSQVATAARNAALDLLTILNSRVRFFYCCASNALDQTPELARIGRQPRRDAGDATPPPHARSSRHRRLRRHRPDADPPHQARTRDEPARVPPSPGRRRRSLRHLDHHHGLRRRPQSPDPRRHLRTLGRRPQRPGRRPGKQPCHACRDIIAAALNSQLAERSQCSGYFVMLTWHETYPFQASAKQDFRRLDPTSPKE